MITLEIPTKSLKPPRRRVDKQKVKDLAPSIKGLGMVSPILIDSNFRIRDGLHRYLAHLELKSKTITCCLENKDAEKIISRVSKSLTFGRTKCS